MTAAAAAAAATATTAATATQQRRQQNTYKLKTNFMYTSTKNQQHSDKRIQHSAKTNPPPVLTSAGTHLDRTGRVLSSSATVVMTKSV
jgi:hypothetical protein